MLLILVICIATGCEEGLFGEGHSSSRKPIPSSIPKNQKNFVLVRSSYPKHKRAFIKASREGTKVSKQVLYGLVPVSLSEYVLLNDLEDREDAEGQNYFEKYTHQLLQDANQGNDSSLVYYLYLSEFVDSYLADGYYASTDSMLRHDPERFGDILYNQLDISRTSRLFIAYRDSLYYEDGPNYQEVWRRYGRPLGYMHVEDALIRNGYIDLLDSVVNQLFRSPNKSLPYRLLGDIIPVSKDEYLLFHSLKFNGDNRTSRQVFYTLNHQISQAITRGSTPILRRYVNMAKYIDDGFIWEYLYNMEHILDTNAEAFCEWTKGGKYRNVPILVKLRKRYCKEGL